MPEPLSTGSCSRSGAGVHLALEGRVALRGGEGERRGRVGRRAAGTGDDRRVRRVLSPGGLVGGGSVGGRAGGPATRSLRPMGVPSLPVAGERMAEAQRPTPPTKLTAPGLMCGRRCTRCSPSCRAPLVCALADVAPGVAVEGQVQRPRAGLDVDWAGFRTNRAASALSAWRQDPCGELGARELS